MVTISRLHGPIVNGRWYGKASLTHDLWTAISLDHSANFPDRQTSGLTALANILKNSGGANVSNGSARSMSRHRYSDAHLRWLNAMYLAEQMQALSMRIGG